MSKIIVFRLFVLSIVISVASCSLSEFKSLAKNSVNFNHNQVAMIMDKDASSAMPLWLITDEKELNLLRSKSDDIIFSDDDKVLTQFISRLYQTVIDSVNAGVGIAAPQVGIAKNIIWVQRFDKLDYPFEVYLNPKITFYSDEKQPCREGCLSIPNRSDTLNVRAQEIEIDYINSIGENKKEKVSGFTAVIFQHEIDHLNGILYTDYLKD